MIKQSHMILKFLAMEGRVNPEHIELVWAAAQLKHCGRQVYDLLPGFIRALSPKPCAHLYSLLCALPPKEHTEQVTNYNIMFSTHFTALHYFSGKTYRICLHNNMVSVF